MASVAEVQAADEIFKAALANQGYTPEEYDRMRNAVAIARYLNTPLDQAIALSDRQLTLAAVALSVLLAIEDDEKVEARR